MRPEATVVYAALRYCSVCGLKLLVYAAFSYLCMRPSGTSVCGLQVLVYAAFSYECLRPWSTLRAACDDSVDSKEARFPLHTHTHTHTQYIDIYIFILRYRHTYMHTYIHEFIHKYILDVKILSNAVLSLENYLPFFFVPSPWEVTVV